LALSYIEFLFKKFAPKTSSKEIPKNDPEIKLYQ
jgi:hypothetical protein